MNNPENDLNHAELELVPKICYLLINWFTPPQLSSAWTLSTLTWLWDFFVIIYHWVSYIFQILNYTQAMNLHTMEAVLLFQNCTHPLLGLKTKKLSTNVIKSAKWHKNVLILNMSQVALSQCHTVPCKVGFVDFVFHIWKHIIPHFRFKF